MSGNVQEKIDALTNQMFDVIDGIDDDLARLKAQQHAIESLRDVVGDLSLARRGVVTDLHAQGMTYKQLADELGVSHGRIQQLATNIVKHRRIGVLETKAKVRAAEMRGQGDSETKIAREVLDIIFNGPGNWSPSFEWLEENVGVDKDALASEYKQVVNQ